ncbi:phosphatidate cytidylyltransferase [Pararhodobacter sp. SW119]|uniref:phosphatidate cytidylyltransferase n=1 Tax=Pararhodobacter sp. SW119 TaxID=2780075 RepID=UPI001ADECFC4|nr:phosphatidate cytidylyltransferase [Pararhodobacter sp. SW119]
MSDARFADLRVRVLSALAMVAVGLGALWLGGHVFAALAIALAGLMAWELYRMMVPDAPPARAEAHGVVAAILVAVFSYTWGGWVSVLGLLAAAALIAGRVSGDRRIFGAYLALILLAGHALIVFRWDYGADWVLWLILIVVGSDVAGYFAGRVMGGPKFWPKVSPKKTWSGTIAGWFVGAAVGAAFMPVLGVGAGLIVLSVLLAFAGQMGDIAESAIKRRMGVKDSSALIPGHGGALDRFDAMIAVALVALVMANLGLLRAVAGAAG